MTAQRDSNRLVSTYSRGMRQRLGLALSLLAQPDLVVLDEPTNLLDPAGIHEMRDLIFGFPTEHGLTVFLSSHLLADVDQLASHVGIIGRGRLLFEGTLSELLSQQRAYVVVEVDQPSIARSVLLQAGWTIRRVGDGATASTLMVDLHERADVARAAKVLVAAGLSLYELRALRSALEDLFLDLTSGANLSSSPNEDERGQTTPEVV